MAVRSMTDTAQIPLILLSGMGADDRVFAPQRAAFPHLQVPAWTDPQPGETLAEYAARFASRVDPGGPCFIGGASLGGMVAMEMAVHLNASAVFLIGSVPDAKQLPFRVRMWKPCAGLIRWIPVGAVQCLSRISRRCFSRWLSGHTLGVMNQFECADPVLLRWSIAALLKWESMEKAVHCPVHHIHGENDWVLPIRGLDVDRKVARGGHVISLTHSAEVNGFLRSRMAGAHGS